MCHIDPTKSCDFLPRFEKGKISKENIIGVRWTLTKKNHPNLTIKHKVLILYKETQNYVYYWKCVKPNCKSFPNCEYISLTGRPFRQRLAEHKQYIRSKTLDKPSGWHFNQRGHELSHLAGLILEHLKSSDPFVLRARENLYIQKFDTYRYGLNG